MLNIIISISYFKLTGEQIGEVIIFSLIKTPVLKQ